jgi:predicted molibdopterin-dependent oxidoreductase YjgC
MAGRFGHRDILEANRLTTPKILEGVIQKATNLEFAVSHSVRGLKEVRDKYGSNALAFLLSPRCTNEEIFLVQRLAREVFWTSNITSMHALAQDDKEDELGDTLGLTASTISQDQIEDADVIVILNSNVTEENPVLGFRIKRAARKGATVISISSTEMEINAFTSLWLHTRRGTNNLLLSSLASRIIERKAFDESQIDTIAKGFDAFKRAIFVSTAEAADATGVSQAYIEHLAEMISDPDKNVVYVYNGDSVREKSQGDLQALGNLVLLTGKIGKRGNGILLTREYSNSQGLIDLGTTLQSSRIKHPTASWERARGARSLSELREAMFRGMIKGLFIIGEDFAVNKDYAKLLEQAEFVVAMDMFETETTALANVALPGSAYAEAEGSVTSLDRRVQAFSRVFDPPAGETGFAILARLYGEATTLEAPGLERVRHDIASFNPYYKQIANIGKDGSFYWNETEEGGSVLYATGFTTGTKKAIFNATEDNGTLLQRRTMSFSTIERIYQDQKYHLLGV